MVPAPTPVPLLLRWQGLLAALPAGRLGSHLPLLAGLILCALLAGLPLVTRSGLSLLIAASALLWVVWALRTPPGRIGAINGWLLLVIGVAVVATGFSPVPKAALVGLAKLLSYLSVYALMRQLLATAPLWWDRLVGALLAGELITSVIGIRQLYADAGALARWSDSNSVAEGTVRIYSTLGNPNLLGGYLLPILPLALVALLRWRGRGLRLFALASLLLGLVALVLTYSRGAWMGMVASLGVLALLLVLRQTRDWPPLWRRLFPLLLLAAGTLVLAVLIARVEPLRVRVMSLLAGREDSSNNFRMNVWTAALQMIQDRPWIGIGPGNSAFNLIYPLYQQPKFNALSAYSIPREPPVEAGIPGLLAGLGLLLSARKAGLAPVAQPHPPGPAQPGGGGRVRGPGGQGLTDTIFVRPEAQLIALFSLATRAAAEVLPLLPDPLQRRRPSPMKLIAGFDAGQSHTTCRLALAGEDRASPTVRARRYATWRRPRGPGASGPPCGKVRAGPCPSGGCPPGGRHRPPGGGGGGASGIEQGTEVAGPGVRRWRRRPSDSPRSGWSSRGTSAPPCGWGLRWRARHRGDQRHRLHRRGPRWERTGAPVRRLGLAAGWGRFGHGHRPGRPGPEPAHGRWPRTGQPAAPVPLAGPRSGPR